jgi:hypothetical protein
VLIVQAGQELVQLGDRGFGGGQAGEWHEAGHEEGGWEEGGKERSQGGILSGPESCPAG